MSCSTISSARTLSLGVVVGNNVGDDIGDGVPSGVVDGFGVGIRSKSVSLFSMIVANGADVDVVLIMLDDDI